MARPAVGRTLHLSIKGVATHVVTAFRAECIRRGLTRQQAIEEAMKQWTETE